MTNPPGGIDAARPCTQFSRNILAVQSIGGLALFGVIAIIQFVGVAARTAEYEAHVFFDNSLSAKSYYQSEGMCVAPSELELVDGKLPLDDKHSVSPPNSLRMKWRSARGGDWRVKVRSQARYGRNFEFDGDALSLWCYAENGLSPETAPLLNLQDSNGTGSDRTTLLATTGALPPHKWVQIIIPLSEFKSPYQNTDDRNFDLRKLESIWLVQRLEDGAAHDLYLDDIRVVDRKSLEAPASVLAAPTSLQVIGAERHFDLTWQPLPLPDLLEYRIYRSFDGKTFQPVRTQRGDRTRTVDFVGKPGQKAFYKITALDVAGHESPPSAVVSDSTRAMSDDELLGMVQQGCWRYYWEGGHPKAGMAVEILPGDRDLVATGASGFGLMALLVGAERGFVAREAVAARVLKIVRFLDRAERFHGVWPHFLDGQTGSARSYFGKYDNGGDLVETAFLTQGLLAARQFFDQENAAEREIRETTTKLWREVEWDWYRKTPDSECLYWHWSPDHGWHISHPLVGWNETMIVYLLAIASPTHGVPARMYHTGWAGQSPAAVAYRQNWSRTTIGDHYTNGHSFYGLKLEVGEGTGADLFFTQFSFMGFDPRGKRDAYANYFNNNRNIALINHAYCAANPRHHAGYGANCWGLSAGINSGGGRPLPRDDNGTICCSAGVGSMAYAPAEALAALKHFYRDLGGRLWGEYGFVDGFNQSQDWFENVWMGLNQAVITVMIENHRSGLLWKKFMANPEIQPALDAIGFVPDNR